MTITELAQEARERREYFEELAVAINRQLIYPRWDWGSIVQGWYLAPIREYSGRLRQKIEDVDARRGLVETNLTPEEQAVQNKLLRPWRANWTQRMRYEWRQAMRGRAKP